MYAERMAEIEDDRPNALSTDLSFDRIRNERRVGLSTEDMLRLRQREGNPEQRAVPLRALGAIAGPADPRVVHVGGRPSAVPATVPYLAATTWNVPLSDRQARFYF